MAGKAIQGEYEITIAAGATEAITITGGEHVIFQFHGDNSSALKLVQADNGQAGHLIEAETVTLSGPHSVSDGPRYLYSAAGDTVTVSVQEVGL